MTSNHPTAERGPTPMCAALAAVLPVLDEPEVDARTAAEARAHLTTCAYCRAQVAAYDSLDAALRRQLGPAATPRVRTEDIMRDLMHEDVTSTAAPPRVHPAPSAQGGGGRRLASWLAPIAAVLVLSLVAGALFASHIRKPGGGPTRGSATPALPLARGSSTTLNAIAMTSPSDGWAVGSFQPATDNNGSATQVVLMHDVNGTWSAVHVPIHGSLDAIAMLSASDGWAVGDQGLTLHYDGHSWTRVPSPTVGPLRAVQMLAPNDVWAIGSDPPMSGVILHYDGIAWSSVPLPASLSASTQNFVSLYGLSMVSPTEGWAAGSMQPITQPTPGVTSYYPTTPPTGLILHYTHGQWAVATAIEGATLQSISVSPSGDGWAAGRTDTFVYRYSDPDPLDNTAPLLLRLTGSRWARTASPAPSPGTYGYVVAGPANGSWLVSGPDTSTGVPGLLRFDGRAWSTVRVPTIGDTREYVIISLAMTSSAEGWAVGYRFSNPDNGIPRSYGYQATVSPVILHYLNGVWTVYMS